MLSRFVLVVSAVVAMAGAQTIETSSAASVAPSSTASQVMPPQATQAFDANNVTSTMKSQWCLSQLNTCPQICGGAASDNECNSVALTYTCVCANGTVPDSTAYENTLPFYICQETYIQCIANNPNNRDGQTTCKTNEQCGTRNATAEALSQTSAAASTTASATGSGSATSAAASATQSGSATMTTYSSGVFAAILMTVFKLLL